MYKFVTPGKSTCKNSVIRLMSFLSKFYITDSRSYKVYLLLCEILHVNF